MKAPTGLGSTITSSITRGSKSIFNDDVSDETCDLFTHMKKFFTVIDEKIDGLVY